MKKLLPCLLLMVPALHAAAQTATENLTQFGEAQAKFSSLILGIAGVTSVKIIETSPATTSLKPAGPPFYKERV